MATGAWMPCSGNRRAGVPVRCISTECQIASHRGYEFDDTDVKDVSALADKFALEIPREYIEQIRGL